IHGFAVIEAEGATRIVPDSLVKQDSIPTVDGRDPSTGESFVTRVLQIQHADAAQLVPLLRPLVAQNGHLAAFPESNVVVVADTADNIQRLADLIERIDQPSEEIELVRLRHASAVEVAKMIGNVSNPGASPVRGVKVVADPRSNSLLLSGDATQRPRFRALIQRLDMPIEGGGNTHVIKLRYTNAKNLATVLGGVAESLSAEESARRPGAVPSKPAGAAAGGQRDVNIHADEENNALIITAEPDIMRSLQGVIRKLDVRRQQVLVEAIIAELSASRAAELGVQWGVVEKDGNRQVGLLSQVSPSLGSGQSLNEVITSKGDSLDGGLSLGLANITGTGTNFAVLLRALASDGSTNILSTPSILTLDNEEAEIMVGQNVPFVTGSYTQTGDVTTPTNPFQTIERQDVGITLRVQPQINEGSAIRLNIEQEVSKLTLESTIGGEITNRRFIKTNVMVDDGQLIVLGGLMDEDHQEREQRIPGLGRLPLIGALFRQDDSRLNKRNLLIFLRPTILRSEAKANAVTASRYEGIRQQQVAVGQQGVSLMPNATPPLLPDLKDLMQLPPPFEID
ncbi:MAG: type II secretion system secretin GspD, partial [Gammaproteobacteria bacterium]|nr:type II secretion system secretin GspD [Gammaproteobacteria bacterium]